MVNRPTQNFWICDADECPSSAYDHYTKTWSYADREAREHSLKTGHKTLVLKQVMRTYG